MNSINKDYSARFNEVLTKVSEDDNGKFDFNVNLHDIEIDTVDGKFIIPFEGDREKFNFTPNAYSQIMSRIGIPSQYAMRTPPELLKPHFDYWKNQNDNREVFVRAKNDGKNLKARAFLSSSYKILDNSDIASAFNEYLGNTDYRVINYKINDDMFNARIVFDDLIFNNVVGPDGKTNRFYGGLHISNGETGNYSINIDLIIWEQWCSNGAIRKFSGDSLFSKKHIGNREYSLIENFNHAFKDVNLKVEHAMELFVNAAQREVSDPVSRLNHLMNERRDVFTGDIKETVFDFYDNRPEPTVYGIASALTQAAQTLPYEKALTVEKIAGDILFKKVA